VLDQGEEGFVLMVEGGAVDWANHGNNLPRMIEEKTDFNRAIEAVMKWLADHGQLDQTLVIVTADHETGGLRGPGAKGEGPPSGPITGRGKGNLPNAEYTTGGHTGVAVPLFATGPGSKLLLRPALQWAPEQATTVDNTDIFRAIAQSLSRSDPARPGKDTGNAESSRSPKE
jgi:alkaline phosphatase